MAEIRKTRVHCMLGGRWVPLGNAEVLFEGDMVVKVISFTPDEFGEGKSHVTRTNPNGSERQCDRRDIHSPHEWQADAGSSFNSYCSGNDGKTP